MLSRYRSSENGATLTEFALLLPLLVMLLVGVIVFGVAVFYQQQINNAARVGARYASTHSAGARCPTVSRLDPAAPAELVLYYRCDPPQSGWPNMTAAARGATGGMATGSIQVSACWSGYWLVDGTGARNLLTPTYDAPPPSSVPPVASAPFPCHLGGKDPAKASDSLSCPQPSVDGDDEGSDVPGNSVTVYVCYVWSPPMGGFLLLPNQITFRAVATEIVHRQR